LGRGEKKKKRKDLMNRGKGKGEKKKHGPPHEKTNLKKKKGKKGGDAIQ